MPIRFYCPFCDQLLGISRRKAGAVIECPRCHGHVGVPAEDGTSAGLVALAEPGLATPPADSADIILSPGQIGLLGLVLAGLLGFAFLAGLLVGALS